MSKMLFFILLVVAIVAGGYFFLPRHVDGTSSEAISTQNFREHKTNFKQSEKHVLSHSRHTETTFQNFEERPEEQANSEVIAREMADEISRKKEETKAILEKEFDYGQIEPFKVEGSAQRESVAEALKDPAKYPERLSVAHSPKEFDLVAYQKDPEKYLNTIEPRRVFQVAQPSDSVVRIQRVSERFPVIQQGESVNLVVKALPEMPVSFTSFDAGHFENKLSSMTVKANAEGLAQVVFTGSAGAIARVNVLVACPVTSGQVKFMIDIR